jgi:hypothetical protein
VKLQVQGFWQLFISFVILTLADIAVILIAMILTLAQQPCPVSPESTFLAVSVCGKALAYAAE